MTHFLRVAFRIGNWNVFRHERLAEVEVEDVGLREVAGERAPLGELSACEALPAQAEVDVVLARPPLLVAGDEQPRVDALPAEPRTFDQPVPARLTGQCGIGLPIGGDSRIDPVKKPARAGRGRGGRALA